MDRGVTLTVTYSLNNNTYALGPQPVSGGRVGPRDGVPNLGVMQEWTVRADA